MPHFAKPGRGLLDRALPAARHRPVVVRGLDLARALRARAQGDLREDVAERRPGRAAPEGRELLHQGARRRRARRSSSCASSDDEVRAFHNMCRHRGNKLVWQDYPGEETSGTCRQFTCKYHGWRYSLEGDLTFVQQESEFFDLDKSDYGLAPVRVETWEGFIFVNLDSDDTTPLARVPRRARAGARGLPVRRDDAGLQVPRRGRQQLEAVHRRLHRVLPRTRSAREAGGVRRVAEAPGATATKRSPTRSTDRTAWCRRGVACRRRRISAW